MADMDKKEIEAAVESILFASGEPVNIERICVALAIDRPTAERILQRADGLLCLSSAGECGF